MIQRLAVHYHKLLAGLLLSHRVIRRVTVVGRRARLLHDELLLALTFSRALGVGAARNDVTVHGRGSIASQLAADILNLHARPPRSCKNIKKFISDYKISQNNNSRISAAQLHI